MLTPSAPRDQGHVARRPADSGDLGPLPPPFADVASYDVPDRMRQARRQLQRERDEMMSRLTELSDLLKESQNVLAEQNEHRIESTNAYKKMRENALDYGRDRMLMIFDECRRVEINHNELVTSCEHLKAQSELIQKVVHMIDTALQIDHMPAAAPPVEPIIDPFAASTPAASPRADTDLAALRDQERSRIARSLDDFFTVPLERALHYVQGYSVDSSITHLIAAMQQRLKQFYHQAMAMSYALDSEVNAKGLAGAIQLYVQHLGISHPQISFATIINKDHIRAARNAERVAFRAICELVENAIHHARCRHICIALWEHQGMICLTVEDDGLGLDPASIDDRVMTHPDSGLAVIIAEAASIGAQVGIESRANGGLRVDYLVPAAQA